MDLMKMKFLNRTKSETWQKARKVMKTEVQHFTEVPEIQHFAIEKVSKNDNVYGVVWGNVVMEYLKTAYSGKMYRRILYQMALHIRS